MAGAAAIVALSGCTGASMPLGVVELAIAGPPVDVQQTGQPFVYRIPQAVEGGEDGGMLAQRWSMLGREDRGAASGSAEYAAAECEAIPNSPEGWDGVIDAIAAQAANHRIVIINESHAVTRHRETTRRLLAALRPLGFSVFAAETFTHLPDGKSPVDDLPILAWPHQNEGFYSREPAFGRVVREAKALRYRLAAYEQVLDSNVSLTGDANERIARREAEQARHLAAILDTMQPDERLLVHVGYAHARETPSIDAEGRASEWMAARLKAMTGIDPLTVAQTVCRQTGDEPFLAQPPTSATTGAFDMLISHPVESFVNHRPWWRYEIGDLPAAIPPSLRPIDEPLIIEAFTRGEPFDAVPVDRVYVEPGEDLPLLLPPGRYTVRAVRVPAVGS